MNCPQCQKELPDGQETGLCPSCQSALSKSPDFLDSLATFLGRLLLGIFLGALVLAGIALVIIAILYAGCVITTGGKL